MIAALGHVAWEDIMMPTITPNSPNALPKISITRIFTKRFEFCASAKAQLLPMMPTHNLPSTTVSFPGMPQYKHNGSKQQQLHLSMTQHEGRVSDIVTKELLLLPLQVFWVTQQRLCFKELPTNQVGTTHNDPSSKYCVSCMFR